MCVIWSTHPDGHSLVVGGMLKSALVSNLSTLTSDTSDNVKTPGPFFNEKKKQISAPR